MNARNCMLLNLIPPVCLVGVLAVGDLYARRAEPKTPPERVAAAMKGFAIPPSEAVRLRLVPGYARDLRAEYKIAQRLLAEWRGLRPGTEAHWLEESYAENALCYNEAARIYPEALGVGLPLSIPTALFP